MSKTRRRRDRQQWRPCGRCSSPFARHSTEPPHAIPGRCDGYLVRR